MVFRECVQGTERPRPDARILGNARTRMVGRQWRSGADGTIRWQEVRLGLVGEGPGLLRPDRGGSALGLGVVSARALRAQDHERAPALRAAAALAQEADRRVGCHWPTDARPRTTNQAARRPLPNRGVHAAGRDGA